MAIALANVFSNNPRVAVIGIHTLTKHPAGSWKRVIDGQLFTDTEIRALYREYGGKLNIGIATGEPSANVAVDADNQAGMDYVEANMATTRQRTKTKKGGHYFFRLPPGVDQRNRTDILGSKKRWEYEAQAEGFDVRVKNYDDPDAQKEENKRVLAAREAAWAAGIKMGPIIDIRGTGGQVVGPGSVRDDRFVYTMVEPWSSELLATVPDWNPEWVRPELKWTRPPKVGGPVPFAKLKNKDTEAEREHRMATYTDSEKYGRAEGWMKATPGAVSEAGGHDHTYYVACRICNGFDVGPDATYELMTRWNQTCQPPWNDTDLAHKVHEAMKLSGSDNGFMLLKDSPEWLASKKVIRTVEFTSVDDDALPPQASTPHRSPPSDGGGGAGGGAGGAGAGGGSPPNNKPNPPQWKGGLQWDVSERAKIKALWDARGVDFNVLEHAPCGYNINKSEGRLKLDAGFVNLVATLKHSRYFAKHCFRYNLLTDKPEVDGHELTDNQERRLRHAMSKVWGVNLSKEAMNDALTLTCLDDPYEPGVEWLESLPPWDGEDRISLVPFQILGAHTIDWRRALVWAYQARCFFRAMVARMTDPGCKVDTVYVLQGEQAAYKSTFFRELLPQPDWFTDTRLDMQNKDSLMVVVKHYVIEWSEGEHAKTPARIDQVKEFVSRQVEDYRSPYDVHSQKRKRRCVFGATTNDVEILHDPTGNRRFHITPVAAEINFALLKQWREQLFAQALQEVLAGERWWLT
jgi:hypothetical protein